MNGLKGVEEEIKTVEVLLAAVELEQLDLIQI
jgi:hypothetical protein